MKAAADDTVEGMLIEDLSPRDLRSLDFYEDDGYERVIIPVTAADGSVLDAAMYLWPANIADKVDVDAAWSYEEFREQRMEAFVRDVVVPCAAEFEEEEANAPKG